MFDLAKIKTIAILLLENRSFDHILGYLSLPEFGGADLDGFRNPMSPAVFGNPVQGSMRLPFPMADRVMPHDLPHERPWVAKQLAATVDSGGPTMKGFAAAWAEKVGVAANVQQPDPLGYCTPKEVPITDFLARNYSVCDRWFAPLPTSTQPNKLMAWSGHTTVDETEKLPNQKMVFDWLSENHIRWRVYHAGFSFLTLLPRFWDDILLSPRFRWFDQLDEDVANEAPGEFPQVIFIEPNYADSPIDFNWPPNDNHPPLPVAYAEDFIRATYLALTSNPQRWGETALFITYDEHGGFCDHVVPPAISTPPPPGAHYTPFDSLGVRVPALVVSPYVEAGSVCHSLFDHTSMLQLLGQKFGIDTNQLTPEIARRRGEGITSAGEVFTRSTPRAAPPPPQASQHGVVPQERPSNPNSVALADAARQLVDQRKQAALEKYPGLDKVKPKNA